MGRLIGRSLSVLGIGLVAVACSDSSPDPAEPPQDFSGTYSISVTNTDNGCDYPSWKIGESAQNIRFDIEQEGASARGELRGLANLYYAALGIGTLEGTVHGSSLTLTAVGTTSVKQGACAYFVRATADITLTGNTINGTMTYSNETNHHADCGALETCSSQQSVAGSRAPK